MHDQMKITVIATGFDQSRQRLKEFVSPAFETQNNNNNFNNNLTNNTANNSTPVQKDVPPVLQPEPEQKTPVTDSDDVWDIPAFLRQKN